MAIIQDWKIRATEARCELTGEPFADEEDFYTCIFDDPESDGFLRKDYSMDSWKKIHETLDPPPFSFWRSTYKAPVQEEEEKPLEDHSVEGMLRRFIEEDDPGTENARYILALMLERKKTLVPTDARETESRKLLFYEHADTGDVFIVADPGLRLSEIEAVQAEVSELLAGEEAAAKDRTEGDPSGGSEAPVEILEEGTEAETDTPEKGGEESPQAE